MRMILAPRPPVLDSTTDGSLWRWQTWKSAATFLFGKRDFHPSQQDSRASQAWLRENHGKFALVG